MKPEDKPDLMKVWNSRNPCHDINSDTGKDMFLDTVEMVLNDVWNLAVDQCAETTDYTVFSDKQSILKNKIE